MKNWKRKRRLKVGRGWGGGVDLEGIRGRSKGKEVNRIKIHWVNISEQWYTHGLVHFTPLTRQALFAREGEQDRDPPLAQVQGTKDPRKLNP